MVYAHKAGLDVVKWQEAIYTGAAGSKSLDNYGKRMLERDMVVRFYVCHFIKDLGICLSECQIMGLSLSGRTCTTTVHLTDGAWRGWAWDAGAW
jgi:3-hydroxyisobutyrate dehydrogenase